MEPQVCPEALDALAADDPRAIRARADLRRVNWLMGTGEVLMRELHTAAIAARRESRAPLRVLELGAGDASLMLRIATRVARFWPPVELTLLDRLALTTTSTRGAFERLGWSAQTLVVDALTWAVSGLPPPGPARWDIIVTNLFLHHFEEQELRMLLRAVGERCDLFVACEPRRTQLSSIGSQLLVLVGASPVTRSDARLSVRAGFLHAELSARWTAAGRWLLKERRAGLFGHCFRASRIAA